MALASREDYNKLLPFSGILSRVDLLADIVLEDIGGQLVSCLVPVGIPWFVEILPGSLLYKIGIKIERIDAKTGQSSVSIRFGWSIFHLPFSKAG